MIGRARTVIVGLLATLALAAGWSAAATPLPGGPAVSWTPMHNLSATAGWSYAPQIAAHPTNGDLWVLWTEDTRTDLQYEVLVRQYLGTTGTWTTTMNLSASDARDGGGVLYMGADGILHVAWTRRSNALHTTDLLYRRWDGRDWSVEQVLDHNPAYHPAPYGLFFVPDAAGRLCLFVTEGSGVAHTCLQEGGWEELSSWTYVRGMRALADIVPGPDGRFHVAALGKNEYDKIGPCDGWLSDAYYTSTDGESWAPLVNLSHFGSIAYDLALAFDQDANLHLLWSDDHSYCSLDSEKSALYERVLEDGVWGERRELTPYNDGQAILDFALQTDAVGHFHLAWTEGVFSTSGALADLSIRYRSGAGADWPAEEVVWSAGARSGGVSLALERGTTPVVVWQEGPAMAEDIGFSRREETFRSFLPLLTRP